MAASSASGLSAIPLRQSRRDHKEWQIFLQTAQFQSNKAAKFSASCRKVDPVFRA
jgi:hypothetical protein